VTIPRRFAEHEIVEADDAEPLAAQPGGGLVVLAVEDHAEDRLVYEKLLQESPFKLFTAPNLGRARDFLARVTPRAILLDLLLGNQDAWKFLAELKSSATASQVPVIVVTSIDDRAKASALGADSYGIKPLDKKWLLAELDRLVHRRTALIIDDDEAARYTLTQMLRRAGWDAVEAVSGREGLAKAAEGSVRVIFLDLAMPGMGGLETLRNLRAEPATASIPVFLSSAAVLSADDRARLEELGAQILPKGLLGPAGVAAALEGIEARAARSAPPEEARG
jgi:CheY-like chemotaxis protein